jgi:hypothetical protein
MDGSKLNNIISWYFDAIKIHENKIQWKYWRYRLISNQLNLIQNLYII